MPTDALLQSGNTLVAQAQAVATQDFAAARAVWRQAGVQCEVAFALDPHHAVTAMHIASCYAWAHDADAKLAWAQIAQHLQEEHAANIAADEAAR